MEAIFWISKYIDDKNYMRIWLKSMKTCNKKYPITKLTIVFPDDEECVKITPKEGEYIPFEAVKTHIQIIKEMGNK